MEGVDVAAKYCTFTWDWSQLYHNTLREHFCHFMFKWKQDHYLFKVGQKVWTKILSFYKLTTTFMDAILLFALVTCKHNMLQGNFVLFWLALVNTITWLELETETTWIGSENNHYKTTIPTCTPFLPFRCSCFHNQ